MPKHIKLAFDIRVTVEPQSTATLY